MTSRGRQSTREIAARLPIRRISAWYVAGFGLITLIGVILGSGGQPLIAILSGVLGVAGISFGVARYRPARSGAWMLLALSVGLLAIVEVVLGLSLTFGDV